MTLKRLKTVRGRTTASALAAVAVALVVAALGLILLQRQVLYSALDSRLSQRVADLSSSIEGGDNLAGLLTAAIADDTIVQIVDASGDVVASTANLEEQQPITDRTVTGSIEVFNVSSIEISDHNEESFRIAARTSTTPTGTLLSVYAGSATENVSESVGALTKGLAIATPMLLVLLGLVLWIVTGRALQPVEAIRSRADLIGARDLDQRVPTTGAGDEIDRLAETMNRMLGRLQTASEQQRSFVADASHELKTPITGIVTQLEAATSAGTLEAYEASSQVTLTEAHRMRRLVEDLLSLARGESDKSDRRKRLIDLDDIVLDEIRASRGSGHAVHAEQVSAGQIRCNPDEARQIVRNLLDNAQRHAASKVQLGLTETDGVVRLTVSDDGPGIAPEDRDRVFDRFVRLDAARARQDGGSGLGLAIVQTLVEAHGGTITISDGALKGASFVVEFPSAG